VTVDTIIDLDAFRLITASAYAGMMAPLTELPSTACVLSGDAAGGPVGSGPERLSLEALDGVRRRWRLGDVSRLADFVPKVLTRSSADPRPALVVPPRLTTAWEEASAGWPDDLRLLGRPAQEMSRIADDKIFVREQLGRLGVSLPKALVVDAAAGAFRQAAAALGLPFVLQSPQGAGGAGTHLIDTEAQFVDALGSQPHVPRWLASAYAGDRTINVAGVVDESGTGGLTASVQTSGIADLGAAFGAYCGSDVGQAATLPAAVLRAAYEQTLHIGGWLHALGHRGIFGADIAVSGNNIAFLEVNPRIQGSSWLLSKLERAEGGQGALVHHVRALLGAADTAYRGPTPVRAGSHLLVRWTAPSGVVRSLPRTPAAGSRVTVTGLPTVGTVLTNGAIMARLESAESLTTPDATALRPHVRLLLAGLRRNLEVCPDEGARVVAAAATG
jgi:ATP-grasp domain